MTEPADATAAVDPAEAAGPGGIEPSTAIEPPTAKAFQVEVTIDADRDTVWTAVSVPGRIREWFGWDYEGLDAEIRYIFVDHADPRPPERILFGDGSHLELVADGPRTVVRVVLPGTADGVDWGDVYDGVEEGWISFLAQLRFLLETRPTGRRRTVYLTGKATGPEVLAVAGAGGRLWHASRYQQITVDPAGHLIAAGAQAPLDSAETSAVGIVVTTYGLDDAAFAEVRDDWVRRWSAVGEATVTTDPT